MTSHNKLLSWHADSSRRSVVQLSRERTAPRISSWTSLKHCIHFSFILKLAIFICKQLKRPAAFGAAQFGLSCILAMKTSHIPFSLQSKFWIAPNHTTLQRCLFIWKDGPELCCHFVLSSTAILQILWQSTVAQPSGGNPKNPHLASLTLLLTGHLNFLASSNFYS